MLSRVMSGGSGGEKMRSARTDAFDSGALHRSAAELLPCVARDFGFFSTAGLPARLSAEIPLVGPFSSAQPGSCAPLRLCGGDPRPSCEARHQADNHLLLTELLVATSDNGTCTHQPKRGKSRLISLRAVKGDEQGADHARKQRLGMRKEERGKRPAERSGVPRCGHRMRSWRDREKNQSGRGDMSKARRGIWMKPP